MKLIHFRYLTVIIILICLTSCRKYIEVDAPYTSFNGENVYTTDATAISAVTTMLVKIGTGGSGGSLSSIGFNTGLSADELTLSAGISGELLAYYKNELTQTISPTFWMFIYQQIYLANSAIEGLAKSNSLTPAVKKQLVGEAKFIRAFSYFYLVNLYGDIPLIMATDYKVNSLMSRAPANEIWEEIIKDLIEAKELLNTNYVGADLLTSSSSTERIRPNKGAATALLARVYLYNGDWINAEVQATELINNKTVYDTVSLPNTFLKNSLINKEAIWQIQPTVSGWNTNDARVYILPVTGPNATSYPVSLNKNVVYSFEINDKRKTNWIGGMKVGADSFYYNSKYRSATLNASVTENYNVFRLAEQYLIRAEARTKLGKLAEAKDDLNIIRTKAGLGQTQATNEATLLFAILEERRHELFCEWGHRWLDLKRTNSVETVMSAETPLKGGTWQNFDKLYPISIDELTANPNLIQTPGY